MPHIPDPVVGNDLLIYFKRHVKPSHDKRFEFYTVVNDLCVFKKVLVCNNNGFKTRSGIVNLIIPPGAYVYAPQCAFEVYANLGLAYRKMRASHACVHSVVTITGQKVKRGYSSYQPEFEYTTGKLVIPQPGFCFDAQDCAGGIHFFLNLHDARNYRL